MSKTITGIVVWLKNWFYDKTQINDLLGAKANKNQSTANYNVVTDASGDIGVEPKINVASGSGLSLNSSTKALSHSNSITAQSSSVFKKITYDGQGHITGTATVESSDLPSHTHGATEISIGRSYAHIGTESGVTQKDINDAVNIQLGALKNVQLISIVTETDLPTASADTLNKLYVKAKSGGATGDGYDIWVTIKTGTSANPVYNWEKIDDFDLQDINVDWSGISNKPSTFPPESHAHGNILTSGKLSGYRNPNIPLITTTDGLITGGSFGSSANTFCEGNDSRLSNARTPTAHTHGNLQDDGQVGDTVQASKNVVTDANGKITTEDKPTIPTDVSDLTDNNNTTFTPKSHSHGNITNTGKIANQFNKPLITDGTGLIGAGSFGSTSGTFAEGNHTHSDYVTSIALVPYATDNTGSIILYYGDEPSNS